MPGNEIVIRSEKTGDEIYRSTRTALHTMWSETSFHIQSLRDNPACAAQEFALLADGERPGLFVDVTFDMEERVCAPFLNTARPRVAVLREQGGERSSGDGRGVRSRGFEAIDVHMSDLLARGHDLADFTGLAACGGFQLWRRAGCGQRMGEDDSL